MNKIQYFFDENRMYLYINIAKDVFSYRYGVLYQNADPICCILKSGLMRFFSRFRLLSRLLRLEPRCAAFLDEDIMILAFQHQVIVVSISKKSIIEYLFLRPSFSNPLNFCSMKRFGQEEVYWGDYGENVAGDRKSVV